jgi:hypothetical protein
MDFLLRYRGELPAHKKCAPEKNSIRAKIHDQLSNLCQAQPLLAGVLDPEIRIARLIGRQMSVDHLKRNELGIFDTAGTLGSQPLFFCVNVDGIECIPLVTRVHELVCELDIRWVRRERAGSLIQDGGDLDNRLKNLFDSLRMPHSPEEFKGVATRFRGKKMLFLLEDDSLVTRFSVETHRLWEPLPEPSPTDKDTDVEVDIRVTLKSTHPMWANVGFPSSGV